LGPLHRIVKCGCVLSLPSCGMQYWHSDGIHRGKSADFDSNSAAPTHALCVFVPLVDLTESTGCTEFWAGSQKYSKLLQKGGEQSLPGGTLGLLNKGDALLYDYRTIHRGTANSSQSIRPVCYFLYARDGYEDVEDQNFRNESVFDAST
jgi:ectoine hydroxylase-related dioxygenase (phytanoyl-CoA dioxygenase family)